MVTLTPRLSMVAGLLRDGHPFADIGTDHAYLPVSLILDGRIPSAAACDVRQGPLNNAASTVASNNVSDKVELLLCSGFQHPDLRKYEDFCMAGMGGNLIADLLAEAPWLQRQGTHLVLQPQSHAEDVREFLFRNGFAILRETACMDNNRVYIALEAEYTGTCPDFTIADCYIGKLPESESPEKYDYFRMVLHRLTARRDALLQYSEEQDECTMLTDIITQLEELV